MFTYEMVVAVIVGGITGGILYLLREILPFRHKRLRQGVLLLGFLCFFITFNALFRLTGVRAVILTTVDKTYPIRLKFSQEMEHFGMKPKLDQKIIQRGLTRLDYSELILWNELRLKLCHRSDEFCSALWARKVSEDLIYETFRLLSNEELGEWIRIMRTAAERELRGGEAPAVDEEVFFKDLKRLSLNLSIINQEKLNAAFVIGENLNSDEASFAMKTILKNEHLDRRSRERFLRYLASHYVISY
jgi:hypothetical protein